MCRSPFIFASRNLIIANHAKIAHAAGLYASGNRDFIDAYSIAYMRSKEYTRIATFDSKHSKKVEGIDIL